MAYGEREVLHDLSLSIPAGQLAVLIGPSGCGKTTTLQLINRLLTPTSGTVFVDGRDIAGVDPVQLRRSIGYVIQEIGLFPHMTIRQNIEIVPRLLGWDEARRRARTAELMQLVGLEERYLDVYPSSLSGGQQQRIGLLRALAAEPPIILMDEPFGALDPITRESLQDEIMALQKKLGKTVVFVTHDMDEALKIADVIILMKDGAVVQAASPEELLTDPANEFVEHFIGKHRLYSGRADTVRDVMRPGAVCAEQTLGLAESVALMERKGVPSLFVVDRDGRLLGQVTIEDIENAAHKKGRTLDCLVHAAVPTVRPDDTAKSAFDLLMEKKADVLAVVDSGQKVLGVVTRTSMVKSLAQVVWKGDNDG